VDSLFHGESVVQTGYAALIWLKGQGRRRTLWGVAMERFVIRQNIEHYRALLEITTDLKQSGVIEKLLLEEEAKLKKYDEGRKNTA